MYVLDTTSTKLQAVLAGAVTTNQLNCSSSWRDITTTAYTPGVTLINTNNTTDVDIVGVPGGSTQRVVDQISIYNADTVAATVTVKYDVSGTEKILVKATLQTGESLHYANCAWTVNMADGSIRKDAAGPSDVQVFTSAGAGTWTKPTSFTPTFVTVVCYGAGGRRRRRRVKHGRGDPYGWIGRRRGCLRYPHVPCI